MTFTHLPPARGTGTATCNACGATALSSHHMPLQSGPRAVSADDRSLSGAVSPGHLQPETPFQPRPQSPRTAVQGAAGQDASFDRAAEHPEPLSEEGLVIERWRKDYLARRRLNLLPLEGPGRVETLLWQAGLAVHVQRLRRHLRTLIHTWDDLEAALKGDLPPSAIPYHPFVLWVYRLRRGGRS